MEIPREDRTFFDFLQVQRHGLLADKKGRAILDEIMKRVGDDPRLLKTRVPILLHVLVIGAAEIRRLVADRQGNPQLNDSKYLVVNVETDWRLNAQVETDPPYHIYLSSNLCLYNARVIELLMGGLGISAMDGSTTHKARFSQQELGAALGAILEGFIDKHVISDSENKIGHQYGLMHSAAQFSGLMFAICHEFGHVVINDCSRQGRMPPFAAFAQARLSGAFEKLISSSQHDPDNRIGLRRLSKDRLDAVYDAWMEEIIADIIGADLAIEYLSQISLFKAEADAAGWIRMGIHMSALGRLFHHVYRNYRDPAHAMISQTHPPVDFRNYCIYRFLYGDRFLEAIRPWDGYAREVMKHLLLSSPRAPMRRR
ncbi:hypothetical protein [Taklimakanibacter deserti]|uniref:hypothetical protein n=1 Tax=Taklimakanibacter deserti TaxID=2267839 RepID=UPI000E64D968